MCLLHAVSYTLLRVSIYTHLWLLVHCVCLSHIQMPTHTKATGEVTGVCCSELCDQPSEGRCPLCNQLNYSGIRGSTPHYINIISLHMKQSAHPAWAHSPVNTCKSIKGPICCFSVLPKDRFMECMDGGVWVCAYVWNLNKLKNLGDQELLGTFTHRLISTTTFLQNPISWENLV